MLQTKEISLSLAALSTDTRFFSVEKQCENASLFLIGWFQVQCRLVLALNPCLQALQHSNEWWFLWPQFESCKESRILEPALIQEKRYAHSSFHHIGTHNPEKYFNRVPLESCFPKHVMFPMQSFMSKTEWQNFLFHSTSSFSVIRKTSWTSLESLFLRSVWSISKVSWIADLNQWTNLQFS
jgi:hypothetical protein